MKLFPSSGSDFVFSLIQGKVRSAKRAASTQALTAQDERMLIDYYKIMRKQGYGKAKEMIMYMAGKTTKKNGNVLGEAFPSEKWWLSFCARNNQPVSFETDEIYGMPRQEVNNVILNNCSQQLYDALTANKYGINFLEHPELIYSCNENYFNLDTMNQLINKWKLEKEKDEHINGDGIGQAMTSNVDHRVDGKIPVLLGEENSQLRPPRTSVITCVNAVGHTLPPLFIHSPDNRDAIRGCYEKYTSERVDDDFFLLWFHEIFLQNISRRGPCILIYDGSNCMVTREMLMAASVNDVIMFCVPATLSHELQPMDLGTEGIFSDTWKSMLLNQELENGVTSNSHFVHLFKEVWSQVATEVVIAERFKAVGIVPFTRQNVTTSNLNTVFESDEFNTDRFGSFMGPDSDVILHAKRKDSYMNAAVKNSRNHLGNAEKQTFDGNQNFIRPSGRITRPTMSMLNQPLNESPIMSQIIPDDDEFREDFPEISNSADDFSSCSDEGNTSMVALSSTVTNLPAVMPPRHANDCPSTTEHVISPTMALQKRHYIPKMTEPNFPPTNERMILSPPGNVRNQLPPFPGRRVIHSVPGALPRKRPANSHHETRPGKIKSHPTSTITMRHSPQEMRPDLFVRNSPSHAELHAFEEVLDQPRKAKFQKAFESGQNSTEDSDPLFMLWKSLKLRYSNVTRPDYNPFTCQVNQVSPSLVEITPKTTVPSVADVRPTTCPSSSRCHCSENYRTIQTPAGNVQVSKNATVIVIMPETKGNHTDSSTLVGDPDKSQDDSNSRSTPI